MRFFGPSQLTLTHFTHLLLPSLGTEHAGRPTGAATRDEFVGTICSQDSLALADEAATIQALAGRHNISE